MLVNIEPAATLIAYPARKSQEDPRQAAFLRGRAAFIHNELVEVDYNLVYGSSQRGTSGLVSEAVGDAQRELTLHNGCQGKWRDARAQPRCEDYAHGVLRHGLHAALSTYLHQAQDLIALRDLHGREATLRSPALHTFEELDDRFFSNALWLSDELYGRVRVRARDRRSPEAAHGARARSISLPARVAVRRTRRSTWTRRSRCSGWWPVCTPQPTSSSTSPSTGA